MTGVLDRLVILDLTRFLSGPYCTLLLAGLGAEVIKIDDPKQGDPTANAPPFAGPNGINFQRQSDTDLGLAYLKRARGKQSTTLDLKHEAGHAIFMRLVESADVVVDNFRPGVAARLGIDYPALAARNPRIISCSITGYGTTGPDRDLKSYDLMAQAASGLMSITGEPTGAPMKIATAFSDMNSGAYAALAILAAVEERAHSGRGQAAEVSMVDCLFAMMMDEPLDCYERLGLEMRQGNRIMRFSPFNAYRSRDGWLVLGAATDAEWRGLTTAIEREDLASHPEFGQVDWRLRHNAAVDELVQAWTMDRTTADIIAILGAHDVPCAPVRSPQEALAWGQLKDRGMIAPLRQPDGSDTSAVAAGLPFQFSRSSVGHREPAPLPGSGTRAVLQRFLDASDEQLARWERDGVI